MFFNFFKKSDEAKWEKKYESFAQGKDMPWKGSREEELSRLLQTYKIKPGNALDIGCGYGEKSRYLASQGFSVIGIDISSKAIEEAQKQTKKVNPTFLAGDIKKLGAINQIAKKRFALILDILTSHFLNKDEKKHFIVSISRIILPGGYYFLDTYAEGSGLATSESEIRRLYEPYFELLESSSRPSKLDPKASLTFYVMKRNNT